MNHWGASVLWSLDWSLSLAFKSILCLSLAGCVSQASCHWFLSRFGRRLELGRKREVRAFPLLSLLWAEEDIFWPWLHLYDCSRSLLDILPSMASPPTGQPLLWS